jgi:hypothetical protein
VTTQGLQVYDASSNLILDVTDSLGTVLGTVSTGTTSGSVTDANFANGTPFWAHLPLATNYLSLPPDITFSGTTLTWTFTGGGTSSTIIYGVY